ncbi:MAG: hypothetical protein ISS90_00745 [Candidatus Omnitrophica bacterium]|nr:hypothetical protein [Candidatus Omnitrophota bacterium]
MQKFFVAFLLVSIALAGCSNVRTYTFKKDRVDQRAEGNRGYVMGTPPPAPVEREVRKRTLIGVDIEIPILPGEKVELPPEEGVIYEEETIMELPEKKTPKPEAKKPAAKTPKLSKDEEEQWIK